MSEAPLVIIREKRGHVALIGLNRPAKRNAFDAAMLHGLARALGESDADPDVRASVLFAHGDHFTAGLDLASVAPLVGSGAIFPPELIDPWGLHGRIREKPLVMAVQGRCLTLGIELILAADITVAADDTRFAQIEIKRGIFPFGGATLRFIQAVGWGNAMRWLLTGDEFDAAQALRLGFVQEVVPPARLLERAVELAQRIASAAPQAVLATKHSARLAVEAGPEAAVAAFEGQLRSIAATDDFAEGVRSFVERRDARFTGR
jgi:enoyl-CoA hydratase/carnithine racemase